MPEYPNLTPEENAALELAEAATPGPWQQNGSHFYGPDPERRLIGHFSYAGDEQDDSNTGLVIVARTTLPAALRALDAARGEAERLREAASKAMHLIEDDKYDRAYVALDAALAPAAKEDPDDD